MLNIHETFIKTAGCARSQKVYEKTNNRISHAYNVYYVSL